MSEVEATKIDEQKPEPQVVAVKNAPAPILVGEDGQLMPRTANQLATVAKQLLMGKGVPRGYTTVEEVIAGWSFAAQLKLPPQVALRNIALIEGTPSLFGDLPLALARRTGELEYFEEFVCNAKYDKICFENKNLGEEVFAGVCVAKRKGTDKRSFTFTVDDAKTAGLWGKISSTGKKLPWSAYPKVMIQRRARSMMLKELFADVLSGASIAEYDHNQAPDLRDVNEESGSDILNKKFGEKKDEKTIDATSNPVDTTENKGDRA